MTLTLLVDVVLKGKVIGSKGSEVELVNDSHHPVLIVKNLKECFSVHLKDTNYDEQGT